jgi:signal transduction histidine kinase
MDWKWIFTNLGTAGVLAVAIGYVLKRILERALDLRFENLSTWAKARIEETVRLEGELHREQAGILKALVGLSCRLRNASRDATAVASTKDGAAIRELADSLESRSHAFAELLFENRAVLRPVIFQLAHELKTPLAHIDLILQELKDRPVAPEDLQRLRMLFDRIDTLYASLVTMAQSELGVDQPANNALHPTPAGVMMSRRG